MKPAKHIVVSFSLAVILWSFTQSRLAGLLTFLSGVLIDLDHLIDYGAYYGLKSFNVREIYQDCATLARREQDDNANKLYLIFHSIEIAIFLWLGFALTKNLYFLAIALGYTGHLIMDAPSSEIKVSAYFLIVRMKRGFRTKEFVR